MSADDKIDEASRAMAAYNCSGDWDDLDRAVRATRAAIAQLIPSSPLWFACRFNLAGALAYRSRGTRDVVEMDEALELLEEAVVVLERFPERVAGARIELARTRVCRFSITARAEDLDAAVDALRRGVAVTLPSTWDHSDLLCNLGNLLQERFGRSGRRQDVDEAVRAFETALSGIEPGVARAVLLQNLGNALGLRFERTSAPTDLDRSIAALDDAIVHNPEPAQYYSNLAVAYQSRFEQSGRPADLRRAVTGYEGALSRMAPDEPNQAVLLSNAGNAHRMASEHGLSGHDNRAVELCRKAVVITAPDDDLRARHLYNLGGALGVRFQNTGDLTDLDDGIDTVRNAVAAGRVGQADRFGAFNLAMLLGLRYEHAGHTPDLDEAILAARDAVQATPVDHVADSPRHRIALVSLLLSRCGAGAGADPAQDASTAVETARAVVRAAPVGHPDRNTMLEVLAVALLRRSEVSGDQSTLGEPVELLRVAVSDTPADHPRRAMLLCNFGLALRRRAGPRDSDEAVQCFQLALREAPRNSPTRPLLLFNLACALVGRAHTDADRVAAAAAAEEVAGTGTASPLLRMSAAHVWWVAAEDMRALDVAADALAIAVGLLPVVAWHGLPGTTREQHLARYRGLAGEAAGCAIRRGRPDHAIELLESGRSVLWAQALGLRTELTDLADRYPSAAKELDRLRGALDVPADGLLAGVVPRSDQGRHVDSRVRMARGFDRQVTEVRTFPGFEKFLRPASIGELTVAAADGPVVVINSSSTVGCHALIITSDGVRVLPLAVTHDEAQRQAHALRQVLRRRDESRADPGDPENVRAMLEWLWDMVCAPVLDDLVEFGTSRGGGVPFRVWWCPTGPFTLLPMHAAGRYGSGSIDTVPDRVVSSYTPTLGALVRARTARSDVAPPSLLTVGTVSAGEDGPLPAVLAELDRIDDVYPIAMRLQDAAEESRADAAPATVERVRRGMLEHPYVHLACHAVQDVDRPGNSGFRLVDGHLRITDLAERPATAGRRELAFLSACGTAAAFTDLPDESIHLAAAMQLLGYRHVVATAWSAVDLAGPVMAKSFYTEIARSGVDHAAHAIHHGQSLLRLRYPNDELAWATYIHIGP